MQTGSPAHTLAPWTGLGVFAIYTAAVLAIAAIQLRRRDV
jgi:ABC-type transport system involved in multi-copper enzyme maturation permease subunit